MKKVCKGCKFWDGLRDAEVELFGTCRYNPPSMDGSWPITFSRAWCGKFKHEMKNPEEP